MEWDMPCGRCDCGTYSYEAMESKVARRVASGKFLPKCKTRDMACVGAVHLLQAIAGRYGERCLAEALEE